MTWYSGKKLHASQTNYIIYVGKTQHSYIGIYFVGSYITLKIIYNLTAKEIP